MDNIMDISSVLLSIQSLLDNNPLENEPGYAGKKSKITKIIVIVFDMKNLEH